MNRETFALSQTELKRVAVISSCVRGDLACARAASLLDLTPRHVKRLKSRYRQSGEAALAHASRGRPSPRRLPEKVHARILHLARTRYAGFNDHHLCEKLREVEGLALGRETLRRLLRAAGIGSPRKRRAPVHRQRRLCRAREGEMLLLDGSLHHWLEDRGPQLTLLGFLDDATRKVPVAEFFPSEDARGYFRLLRRFGRAPREAEKAWRPAPADLERICCFVHERSVSNDNVVQWAGRRFQIPPQPQRFTFAGARVHLYESLEGRVAIYYGETKLHHTSG